MHIQLNSDNHIVGSSELFDRVQSSVERELRHVSATITRVEVHLNDVNSSKSGGDDKRCMLEARLANLPPIAVEHSAETIDLAVDGAAAQLARAIKTTIGKAEAAKRRGPSIGDAAQEESS